MHRPLSLLVIGHSKEDLSPVTKLLDGRPGLELATHVTANSHGYPTSIEARPDALVLAVGADWRGVLPPLVDALPAARPPFVVVGPDADIDLLRAAMRAGARDAVTVPFVPEEFLSALGRIAAEERLRTGTPTSRIIAFMNSKGGSGATVLASNTAVALATLQQGGTLVVDMDYQFGSLPTYIDMAAKNGLIKALEFADTLDQAALEGYVQIHKTGLHVLAAAMEDIILPEDVSEYRIKQLLATVDGVYRYVVVDLPRRIDSATTATLMQADQVVVVTQQTLAHLHDTKRLMFLLQGQLGITSERLRLVVNRYDKKAEIRIEDYSSVLVGVDIETIPGDYRRVAESINLGEPLALGAPRSPLGKRFLELANSIAVTSPQPSARGGSLFGWLSRSSKH